MRYILKNIFTVFLWETCASLNGINFDFVRRSDKLRKAFTTFADWNGNVSHLLLLYWYPAPLGAGIYEI